MAEQTADVNSPVSGTSSTNTQDDSFIMNFINEIINSPINFILVGIIAFLVYKIFRSKTKNEEPPIEYKELPKIRRDFTVEDLRKYNGTTDERILVAVNGSVYDVTKGKRFYGPGEKQFYFILFFFIHDYIPISCINIVTGGSPREIRKSYFFIFLLLSFIIYFFFFSNVKI